ncbi:heme-binding protein [Candidatus Bathyarchaeota archaeon]|nr:heme-binding protein [Candidatus Bathyarchaeota archaeon]MBL7168620.1 heme-binding protein [Candidatus Bathyarchaeota archaeon]
MVETPSYEVVGEMDGVEVRLYPRLILATVMGDSGGNPFRLLFQYISGGNSGGSKISMTAPVLTPERIEMTAPVISEGYSMSFVVPSKYTMDTVPTPNDERIRIQEVSERKLAVVRFRGWAREGSVEKQKARLISVLQGNGVETVGEPFLMRYNSPWTPGFMRRNELGIEIAG